MTEMSGLFDLFNVGDSFGYDLILFGEPRKKNDCETIVNRDETQTLA